ncbi:PREDICTED: EH domain-binding protein 1-like [Crocodylus porosus]|uniref:EH domain-binding protein 1-like n=1 Tax=Crocodylus porosus TaxID=8502 RepID=UPI00093B742E|nr:PREDICTED: EH domain-binding protein 1-like [Crocodylus porosus]
MGVLPGGPAPPGRALPTPSGLAPEIKVLELPVRQEARRLGHSPPPPAHPGFCSSRATVGARTPGLDASPSLPPPRGSFGGSGCAGPHPAPTPLCPPRQPDKLVVVWTRRNRRICTKAHGWQPGIENPYRGLVVWMVPENVDITVTLYRDPHAEEYEDKEWMFVVENESRKVLASVAVNLQRFARPTPTQTELRLRLRPRSTKVVAATLQLTLTATLLYEGKAT